MQRLRTETVRRAAWLGLAACLAATPVAAQVGGSIAGLVRDEAGIAQMGAAVDLLTSDGRVASTVKSDYRGWFQFTDLFPGTYSIEVQQANFSRARKTDLSVEPGKRTFLDVCMRGLFASLQLSYGSQVRDMTERWQWVLRAKHSRRNVLRLMPGARDEHEEFLRKLGGTFEDTHAYAEISAGQGQRSNGLNSQQDLGTAFAVATSIFGDHDLTVSGNRAVGNREMFGGGSTAFRTTYAKDIGVAKPEVALTVRQLQSSAAAATGFLGAQSDGQGVPRLETLTLEFGDSVELTDALRLEYGLLFESVKFVQRLQFASPYAKAVYELAPGRELAFSYASGVPPEAATRTGQEAALRGHVRQLGMFPRVALASGMPTVQRSEHVEAAYRQRFGQNMVEAAVYRDSIHDAAVAASVPDGVYTNGDIVPELYSATATLNGGNYRTPGLRVSYARKIRDRLQTALGYGYAGVLAPSRHHLETGLADELRGVLESQRAHLLLASVSAELPGAGTVMTGSYQWSSRQSVLPADPFNDFSSRSAPGLNLVVRQPLPIGDGMPGQIEVSADLRNLLKTGYVPLHFADGRILNLLQSIRSYSGALSYIF